MYMNDTELSLISSTTSIDIGKIMFTHSPAFDLSVGDACWARLDEVLTKVAQQSKHRPGLEVTFWRISVVLDGELSLKECLPKLAKRGRLTVLGDDYEVLYSSDEVGTSR